MIEAMEKIKVEQIKLVEPSSVHTFTIEQQDTELRLDMYLKKLFPSYSRNFLQELIWSHNVVVNNKNDNKCHTLTKLDDVVTVTFPPIPVLDQPKNLPETIAVEVIHIDEHFMVINKPANLAVHPPKLNSKEATLVDWLLKTFHELKDVGLTDRPGIVHRLDKDTSGIMLVARNNCAHALLCEKFKERTIEKTYLALVSGHPDKEGSIEYAIMRHPTKRNTMTHVTTPYTSGSTIRNAKTLYKVLEYFEDCSLVEVKPLTGRTHQIRIHFAALGHPLLGDYVYGKKSKIIARQALHAYKLSFEFNGQLYEFCKNPPEDFQFFLDLLRNNKTKNSA
jgi:23S rRNA pseudouridine1911/1915/1917 synthase